MRCGVRAVLRILSCALGFGVVLGDTLVLDCIWGFGVGLGGALCFGLYLGFRCGNWEVLWVLGYVLDDYICWWVALFSGLLHWFWEVLCVLVFWKVDFGRRVEN